MMRWFLRTSRYDANASFVEILAAGGLLQPREGEVGRQGLLGPAEQRPAPRRGVPRLGAGGAAGAGPPRGVPP